jgi:hypothetical protein
MTIDVALPRVTRFSIGRVLRDTFGIFGRNILLFGGAAIIARLLLLFAPASVVPDPEGSTDWVAYCVTSGLDIVVWGLSEAAITFATFQCLRGRRANAGDIAHGMRSAVPIVLAGTIYSLPLYAVTVIEVVFAGQDLLAGILTLVAAIVAIALTLMWWVYVPAIAIEGKGVFASLGRSVQLTKGRRWAIVGVYVLLIIAVVGPMILIAVVTGWSPASALSASPFTLLGAVGFVFFAISTALYTVLVTVAYFHLRMEKEGAGAEDIVRVFD